MIKATIKIVLDNKPMSNGKYAVYLRILKNGKRKMISLGMQCDKVHFSHEQFTRQHKNYQIENETLGNLKSRAYKIIREFQIRDSDFTLLEFERNFRTGQESPEITVWSFWNDKVQGLIKAGKIGNARAYRDAKRAFFKFETNKNLHFKDITPTLLNKYEIYLRSKNNGNGGISIKMRTLRALYNSAIDNQIISIEHYPFKIYKISKLKSETNKRALTFNELKAFNNLDISKYPNLKDSKNYFMFSFYTRGMNYVDIMKLKWNDIHDNKIVYLRSKTGKRFVIKILKPVQNILDDYKKQETTSGFVFPILQKKSMTPLQIEYRKDKTLKKFNKELKEIARLQGIEKNITSYVARHSYATFLKEKDVSTDKISESMGHANLDVTLNYLKEFGNDVIDDANETLLEL